MSKHNEIPPSDFEAPPYEYDKSQQPPAYYGPPPPQQGYPNPEMPPYPQQGYPNPGMAPHPQHYNNPGMQPTAGYPMTHPQQPYQYSSVVVQQPFYGQPTTGPPPPDHMTAAILATLCCFWPTGIIAIMRASDSRAAAARGDIAGANSLARSAKSMINISIILGVIAIIIIAIIMGVYFGIVIKKINDMNDDYD